MLLSDIVLDHQLPYGEVLEHIINKQNTQKHGDTTRPILLAACDDLNHMAADLVQRAVRKRIGGVDAWRGKSLQRMLSEKTATLDADMELLSMSKSRICEKARVLAEEAMGKMRTSKRKTVAPVREIWQMDHRIQEFYGSIHCGA